MGVWFDDPDIRMDDINFYNILASQMENSFIDNEGLISFDQEYNTKSCYVELHRNGELSLIWFFRGNARKRLFQFPLKPSSRTRRSKSYRRSNTNEFFTNKRIRKTPKVYESKFQTRADVVHDENQN